GAGLGSRMGCGGWKKGSSAMNVYLTNWYYPVRIGVGQELMFGPPDGPVSKTWNGAGTYPDPGSLASHPFPGGQQDKSPDITTPDCTASCISAHLNTVKSMTT